MLYSVLWCRQGLHWPREIAAKGVARLTPEKRNLILRCRGTPEGRGRVSSEFSSIELSKIEDMVSIERDCTESRDEIREILELF